MNEIITTNEFDQDEQIDANMVRLDNRTSYGLNILYQLLMRDNKRQAMKALSELRLNGRLFDSEKFFVEKE